MNIFKRNIKSNRGFTLVELLVVMAAITILSGAVFQLFTATGKYVKAVESINDYQALTTDALYRLRTELADRAWVETIATDSTDSSGAMKYDVTNLDYGYIVMHKVEVNPATGAVTGGGATLQGVKLDPTIGAPVRTADQNIAMVDSNKPYRIEISMRSSDTGKTDISASVVRTDYKDETTGQYTPLVVYSQGTTMKLRSGIDSTGQDILRYRLAA